MPETFSAPKWPAIQLHWSLVSSLSDAEYLAERLYDRYGLTIESITQPLDDTPDYHVILTKSACLGNGSRRSINAYVKGFIDGGRYGSEQWLGPTKHRRNND